MDIGEVWQTAILFFYEDKDAFTEELTAFLKENKVKSVIDCSCGVGFPSIDLKKKGFDVYCADCHPDMIKMFKKNMKRENVNMPFTKSRWQNLSLRVNKQFDCVMCRGNSFIYINSWGKKDFKSDGLLNEMTIALKNFYNLMKDNGVFYIDLPHDSEYSDETIFFNRFDKRKFNSHELSLIWDVKHLSKKKLRKVEAQIFHWRNNKIIGRDRQDLYAPLLYPSVLIELMKNVGFKNIKSLKLENEQNYSALIAQK